MSLRNLLLHHLADHSQEWVMGSDLERLAAEYGYKGSTASRRLREMAEENVVHVHRGKQVMYNYQPRYDKSSHPIL